MKQVAEPYRMGLCAKTAPQGVKIAVGNKGGRRHGGTGKLVISKVYKHTAIMGGVDLR